MNKKSGWIIGAFMVLLMVLNSGQAIAKENDLLRPAAAGNSRAQLSVLVAEALANNPDLKSAEARWEMAQHQIVPARSLDDPRLSFTLSNYPIDDLSGDVTPMTGKEIQLSQMFPFPGKLAAKEEMAVQQAAWYRGAYEDARGQLVQQVKDAWYRLYFQQRAIDITRQNVTVINDFIRLTETRYEVGTGMQQDVLKAQVERSKLLDKLYNQEQQKTTVLAELNRLLNRPAPSPVEIPEKLSLTSVDISLQSLVEISRTRRPLFDAYQATLDRYQAQRKLAKLNHYPDFNLFAGYRQREEVAGDPAEGSDFVSVGISINIPLWQGKRTAAVSEADSAMRMAHSELDNFRNRVDFAIADQYAQMEKNRNLVELFHTGIIPQAEQSFEAGLSAYQVGDADFLNLLDSLTTLYRYQIDYHRALSDHERSVAKLEAAVGIDLNPEEELK
ncbi:MAG: TolC family protein [Syntrophotaleaceae bacterium]